ncbi:MAG: type II toxin-antitoxin system HipA family toxin, partial [Clostridia bacterium]|nr:type II toxin-antitoxin system HipA family toxin [Clostridia bacterium]
MSGVNDVKVVLWGTVVGYLHKFDNSTVGFQYDSDFLSSGIELSPVKMPLSNATYSFPTLSEATFHGLPGLVADSLPDKFGTAVINRYLEGIGKSGEELSAIEKLCYTGKRGMGALEYMPAQLLPVSDGNADIDALASLAEEILSNKKKLSVSADSNLIANLIESGSSVGGARAKTLIAWNPKTNEIKSGQIETDHDFEYWLLKFGNIKNNRDKDASADKPEYTKVEYAYYLMAKAAGIQMSECRLHKENGVSHFMTKRFDRKCGEKLHMQSLGAIAHMDFNNPRTNSYEEAFAVMRKMNLTYSEMVEFYRRMIFNELARNFDDHVKNISFLMDKKGTWTLAPAYDITFSYNPGSVWVSSHQMLINGKVNNIGREDLSSVAV